MKKENRNYLIYLEDIKISIERIFQYTKDIDYKEFEKNQIVIDAVIRNFEIIGEASKNVNEKIKERYPKLTWKEMYFLRDLLSHEYFGIDLEILWAIITNNLPNDLESILEVISEIGNEE